MGYIAVIYSCFNYCLLGFKDLSVKTILFCICFFDVYLFSIKFSYNRSILLMKLSSLYIIFISLINLKIPIHRFVRSLPLFLNILGLDIVGHSEGDSIQVDQRSSNIETEYHYFPDERRLVQRYEVGAEFLAQSCPLA